MQPFTTIAPGALVVITGDTIEEFGGSHWIEARDESTGIEGWVIYEALQPYTGALTMHRGR
jgi:hypothetical protein